MTAMVAILLGVTVGIPASLGMPKLRSYKRG